MSYFLRKIHKSRWDPAYRDELGLGEADIPSDCLADLNSARCTLSLWSIDAAQANVQEVVVAMATTRDIAANFEYALIAQEHVLGIGRLQQTEGDSPNMRANNEWHWHLCELTARQLTD